MNHHVTQGGRGPLARIGRRVAAIVAECNYAQTVIAPYAVRARRGAPAATPVHWAELSDGGLSPRQFTMRTMADRLGQSADPWEGMARHRHGLPGARRRLAALQDRHIRNT